MNTQYEEESGTDRIMDVIVGIVGLGPKIALLIWILLAGGVPMVLQQDMDHDDMAMDTSVPVATEQVAQVAPTDIPATATVEMLELVPIIPPPSIGDADVLAPGDFNIDPSLLGLVWAAQQVGGAAVDPVIASRASRLICWLISTTTGAPQRPIRSILVTPKSVCYLSPPTAL